MLDTSRIEASVDVRRTRRACVTMVGVGGGSFPARQLTRSGVGAFRLVDPDVVSSENLCRQVYMQRDIGKLKVDVTANALRSINPAVRVDSHPLDVTKLTPAEEIAIFSGADLTLGLTDNHAAQAAANRLALKYNTAYISVGIYAGGVAGEVFFMRRGGRCCYHCWLPHRYDRHAQASAEGKSLDPASDGATVMAGALLDSIATEIAIGILTEGSANRYGRLLERLGARQLLVVKMDPDWETSPSRDIVRDELGIQAGNPYYCAYNTIAMTPPASAIHHPCPDCEAFRRPPALAVDPTNPTVQPADAV